MNIFELLQNEEPEMARLIDQASSLDSICNYLPQISVNTTSKVLDNLTTSYHHHHQNANTTGLIGKTHSSSSLSSMLFELSKASQGDPGSEVMNSTNLYKLEDTATEQLIQQQGGFMHPSASFKELCELLSIKKSPSVNVSAAGKGKNHNQLVKLKLLTPPLTPTEIESANTANNKSAMKPARTSMRLFQKRNIKKEVKIWVIWGFYSRKL